MNILNDKTKEEIELFAQKWIKKQQRFITTLHPQKGQIVWELNVLEKTLVPAEFAMQTITYHQGLKGKINKKIVVKPFCLYELAINKTIADHKFGKQLLALAAMNKKKKQPL